MSSSRVEAAVIDLLIGHRGPAATALMHWLITGDQLHDSTSVDLAWRPPDAPYPFT
ncbi:hypothetical protein [Mycobacteroides abscessus]|uniref:hypothetical protein n=1 Tax=Mycobacteroides abscessus TaxID=36809 RepID=UPI00266B7E4E|nr:hypothetical protein [Mycobacteroides abscessus]MDO3052137.1 hypothetical protein [Mycobacteroides abscessus subsp. abscessus]